MACRGTCSTAVMNNLRHVLSPRFPRGNSKATLPLTPEGFNRTGSLSYSQDSRKKKKKEEKRGGGERACKLTQAQQECSTSLPSLEKLLH